MLAAEEMVLRENKMLIAKGKRKGKKEIAKKMLQEKMPIEVISRITGLTETKIKKL